jgi:hypothetical protein
MPRPKALEPKYRHHKSSGQAYVVIDGKDVWLGAHGSAASRKRYLALLNEWISRDRQGPPIAAEGGPTVTMVIAAFWSHAKTYYRDPDGCEAGELDNYRQALRPLKRLYGATPAAAFSPLKLKAVRIQMIKGGTWSRNHTIRQVGRINAVFKWAVENERVPPAG